MKKQEIIDTLLAAGACKMGIEPFLSWEGSYKEFAQQYPFRIIWAYDHCPDLWSLIEPLLKDCARELLY